MPFPPRRRTDGEAVSAPLQIAEDDHLRSLYMRELVQGVAPRASRLGATDIPKTMVQFWHDFGALPADVRECLDSWELLTSQGFKRKMFDDTNARTFILGRFGRTFVAAFDRCHHPAMRCDYFRLCYIFAHGGFYVDADEQYTGASCEDLFRDDRLKLQPLCYDALTDKMVATDVLVRKEAISPAWIFYVNNNPIVAPPFHPIIRLALARSTRILLRESGRPDIQSTTGPGNLTASLVMHSLTSRQAGKDQDFLFLNNWESISISRWPLSYRDDERNWRLWNPTNETVDEARRPPGVAC